jgi:hypothetical protein
VMDPEKVIRGVFPGWFPPGAFVPNPAPAVQPQPGLKKIQIDPQPGLGIPGLLFRLLGPPFIFRNMPIFQDPRDWKA